MDNNSQLQVVKQPLKEFSTLQISSSGSEIVGLSDFCKHLVSIDDVRDAIRSETCTISEYAKANKPVLQLLFTKKIGDMLTYYGLNKDSMPIRQLELIVENIIRNYGYLKFEEIPLVFKHAFMSDREFYNKINGQVIVGWFKDYAKYRMEEAVNHQIEKKEEEKRTWTTRESYIKEMREKAERGDEEARQAVENYNRMQEFLNRTEHSYQSLKINDSERYAELAKKDAEMVAKSKGM